MYIHIPDLLRIKSGPLKKMGRYLRDKSRNNVVIFYGEGIENLYGDIVQKSFEEFGINLLFKKEIKESSTEFIFSDLNEIPSKAEILIAIGGGKVVDYGKYLSFLRHIPFISVPTALSNDAMASPTASLTHNQKRKSFKAHTPVGVIIDTEIIKNSPERYTYSGIGDMAAKMTATFDWKLAFHHTKEIVNDFAVLVASQSLENVLGSPTFNIKDEEFISRLAGSLVMSGVAMEICGSSRPASGSEHLISHAYDQISSLPSLHGLQVGISSYAISHLQNHPRREDLKNFFLQTGFAQFAQNNPLSKNDFKEAIKLAPTLRENYYTILSQKENVQKILSFCEEDPLMKKWLS